MKADGHIERAARMAAMGFEAEAKWYLRHLARGSLRNSRRLRNDASNFIRSSYAALLRADKEREAGLRYARASRAYRGSVQPAVAAMPYTHSVPNPHWPALTSHGVFVFLHSHLADRSAGGKRPNGWLAEVQVLTPDAGRSQACSTRLFGSLEQATRYARTWVTVGEAAILATQAINAEDAAELESAAGASQ